VKTKNLDQCLTELHSLQESRAQNEDKEWQAKQEGLHTLKRITETFLTYLQEIDLRAIQNGQSPFSGRNIVFGPQSSRYLPDHYVVLPG